MNSHEILRTAIKITGLALLIYAVVQAASYLPLILEQVKNAEMGMPVASYISSIAVPIIFGFLLWLFPASVSNTIIKNDLNVTSQDKLLLGIEKVGIRILGLYLLYHGISDLVANYASYHQAVDMFGKNIGFSGKKRYTIIFITTGVEIFLSLLLILGAAGITNIIRKVRYAS